MFYLKFKFIKIFQIRRSAVWQTILNGESFSKSRKTQQTTLSVQNLVARRLVRAALCARSCAVQLKTILAFQAHLPASLKTTNPPNQALLNLASRIPRPQIVAKIWNKVRFKFATKQRPSKNQPVILRILPILWKQILWRESCAYLLQETLITIWTAGYASQSGFIKACQSKLLFLNSQKRRKLTFISQKMAERSEAKIRFKN